MEEYRAYVLDAGGQVKDLIEFLAPDDQAALVRARQYLDSHDGQVCVTRVVARLQREELSLNRPEIPKSASF